MMAVSLCLDLRCGFHQNLLRREFPLTNMLIRRVVPAGLWLVLFTIFVAGLSPVFATRRERKVDTWKPIHYNIAVTLSPALNELAQARTEITVTAIKDGISKIDLDFGELTVDAVMVNDRPSRFTHANGRLDVTLPLPAAQGTSLTIAVEYHGKPKDGLILTNDKDGVPSAVGDNWPDRLHHWVPSLDHPSAKATVTFSINAPAGNIVVANGRFVGVENASNSTQTWTYVESSPIPPYCMIFAAGRFAKIAGPPALTKLEYYVPRSDESVAAKGFAPAAPSLKLFTETIAPYPYEKLALIVGATQFGGMENSGAIVFASTILNANPNATVSPTFGIRKGLVELVAHEIAHQWFGDSVTEATWSDLWLSEGFATYFAGFFVQRTDGEQAFRAYMSNAAESYFNFAQRKRIPIHDTETENLFQLLNANNYQKGAWILHMLRAQIGDEAFFRGLRNYYKTHKNSVATSEDLRTALEASSGQNLRQFFKAWIYGTGHPNYQWSWNWNAKKKTVGVAVKQLQAEEVFPNWLPLEITMGAKRRRLILRPTTKKHVQQIRIDQAPTAIALDPENTVLKEVKKY